MPFDEAIKGDPFRGDLPDWPDREPWGDLAAIVQRQVSDMAQLRFEPAIRHQNLRLLQQRRQPEPSARQPEQRAGSLRDGAVTQFDFLPVNVGFDTLLVPDELLITGRSYDGRPGPARSGHPGRPAKDFLDALQMEAREVDCDELQNRVLRLIPAQQMGPQELADVARVLRSRGFAASLTNITPDAAVHKSPPNPSPGPAPHMAGLQTSDAASRQPTARRQPDSGPRPPAKVAIIDTGIAAEIRTDGWLDSVPRHDDNIDPLDMFPLRYPPPSGDGYLDFSAGHGTFVAGIIQQIAPGAEITVYRAVDGDGIASEVTVACEMIRAVKEGGARIINLSLGCQTQDDMPPIAIQAALEIISEWERETGEDVLIIAAAGNYADRRPSWPAAFRRVVSVAGLAPDMLPSQWSSHGFWVTCSTIGQGVRSTYVEGRESPLVYPEPDDFGKDAWAVWSGTSFAAPQITGAVARLHQSNGYPLREALARLLAAGQAIPDFGQALKILPGI
jgi:hypothetical protein